MNNFEKTKYICPKCLWHIKGKCRYPDVCVNFSEFKQDNKTYELIREYKSELKEARHYLMEAVDGFRALGKYLDEHCKIDLDCDKCPLNNGGNCRAWKHTKAVMKLIGGK